MLVFGNLKALVLVLAFIHRVTKVGRQASLRKSKVPVIGESIKLLGSLQARKKLRKCCQCLRDALMRHRIAARLA